MSGNVPQHIGFIVDGNRRWAKERGLKPIEGHYAGYDVLHETLSHLLDQGVKYATIYVFSTENWKRSPLEVRQLLKLLLRLLTEDVPIFVEKGVRLRIAGARDDERLPPKLRAAFGEAEAATAHLTRGTLVVCINYGGKQEIVDVCKKVIQSGIAPEDVTEEVVQQNLYVPDIPSLDLIVRTSGEHRLSNFMIWEGSYAELLFIDKPWPDLTKADIDAILEEYQRRNRRFGG